MVNEKKRLWRRNGLLALAGVALLVRVWALAYPNAVVFDEVHFGKFVTAYCCSRERIFDIHPPHVKILIAGLARVGGYEGGFAFKNIGDKYGDQVPIVWLRLLPALTGTLIPLLAFVWLRQLGASYWGALLAGGILALDNGLVGQSRVISLDSVMIASILGSLVCWWAADKAPVKRRLWWLLGAGALAGLAVGAKFTGLVAIGMLGLATLWRIVWSRSWRTVGLSAARGLVVLWAALIVYAVGWVGHYMLLVKEGPGDAWQVPSGNVWADTIEMHKKMFDANYNLKATHPYSSKWHTWPLMERPVFYWSGDSKVIYLLGNPVVWWGAFAGLCSVVIAVLFSGRNKEWRLKQGWWILLAYVVAMAPLVRVPRALFIYHYFTPLIFSVLLVVYWLDRQLAHEWGVRTRQKVFGGILVAVLAGFIIFIPRTYGVIGGEWLEWLYWFDSWR